MDNFKYGPAFFAINEFHFSHYDKCLTSDEMFAAQEEVKTELAKEKEINKNREVDYDKKLSGDSEDGSDSDDLEEERKYYEELNRKMVEKDE